MSSAFKLVSSKCVPMTKELAEEFRSLTPSPTERDLDPRRIRHLERKAADGLLVTFHWAKAKFKGKWLRMNGQHSSTMLCNLNGDFPQGLFAHVDEYEVADSSGMALLFRQFDDRKSGRTGMDVAGAYQGLVDVLKDVPKAAAKMAVEGIVWYSGRIEGLPVPSGDDAYVYFNDVRHHTFIQWIGDLFSIKTPELRKPYIVAAMYATFQKNEAEARRFWEWVAKGGHEYADNEPAAVLSAWYVKAKDKDVAKPVKPAEYYQAGLFGWNAHRAEKQITSIRVDVKKGWLEASA
jgi:hypothetical protein